jgi:quercetin dioxygenase-like cupin family protein
MSAADKGNRYACEQVVEIEQEPRHHLVIENEFVRGFAVEIAPHDRTLCHHHPHDYLVYVAGSADIVNAARDEEPKQLSYGDGECELLPAGMVHVVENLGEKPFRNVVVELLPRTGGVGRGARPQRIRGQAIVSQILDDERAAIFNIEMEPGAEVAVNGPAIVAAPYGHELNPEDPGVVVVNQNRISNLAWIPPGRQAGLGGCKVGTERAVVFQLGGTDEESSAVPIGRDPLRSLRAHAEDPD